MKQKLIILFLASTILIGCAVLPTQATNERNLSTYQIVEVDYRGETLYCVEKSVFEAKGLANASRQSNAGFLSCDFQRFYQNNPYLVGP